MGWWWGRVRESTDDGPRDVQREVDVVAVDHEHAVLALGSCKWTTGAMSHRELTLLRRLAARIASGEHEPELYLFSRAGFEAELVQLAYRDPACHLIEVGDLF